MGDGRNEGHLVDVSAANAHFLAWVYLTDDRTRRDRTLTVLHGDLIFVDEPRITYWFPRALIGPNQGEDFISTVRKDVLSRHSSSGTKFKILDILYRISKQPKLKEHMIQAAIPLQTPVFWIMRALQWHLCTHEETQWDKEMVSTAFDSMSYVLLWYRAVVTADETA